MILQALQRYYDLLASDPDSGIPLFGYCMKNVSFAINLSEQGEILDIFSLFRKVTSVRNLKEVPIQLIVPEEVKRSSGIAPNFLCDNSAYVLGLSDKETRDPDYALKRFDEFCRFNKALLSPIDCIEARAVVAFLDSYSPLTGQNHPAIQSHLEELLLGGNIVFRINNRAGYVHEQPEIRHAWENYAPQKIEYTGQCLVTGDQAPIARLHQSLQGISGGASTGTTLVSFNAPAYESYNRHKGQGLNSPVSEKAAFAYTTALKFLLSRRDKHRKLNIGDATIVYWAESLDRRFEEIFISLFDPGSPSDNDENISPETHQEAEQWLGELVHKIRGLQPIDSQGFFGGLDSQTRFHILGLTANKSRTVVRFYHSDPFEKIVYRIMAHYSDLAITREFDNQPEFLTVWHLINETVSKKAKDPKPSPLLTGALFQSIIHGKPYPTGLYYAILTRIRADQTVNYTRAATIKAFLSRKFQSQPEAMNQEVFCMSLNEQSKNQAYLLGRLFAVLEKAQQDAASPSKLNATIKDRYFTAACASPATVFPILLRLSQHHISKAQYGYTSDRLIAKIMELLDIDNDPIPSHLTLDDQGKFMLGYYHQRVALYQPNNPQNTTTQLETES